MIKPEIHHRLKHIKKHARPNARTVAMTIDEFWFLISLIEAGFEAQNKLDAASQ